MTLGAAAVGIAGSLAGFTGPWLYVNAGVPALAWTSAAAVFIALGVAVFFVRENVNLSLHESPETGPGKKPG